LKKILIIVSALCFTTGWVFSAHADSLSSLGRMQKIEKIKVEKIEALKASKVSKARTSVKAAEMNVTAQEQAETANELQAAAKLKSGGNEVASMNHQVGAAWTKKAESGQQSPGAWHGVTTGTGATSVKHDSVAISGAGTLNAKTIGKVSKAEKVQKATYSNDGIAIPKTASIIVK